MGSQPKTATPDPAEIAVTSVKIERQKLDRLREIAAADRRTVSGQVRHLIDQCIDEHASQEPQAA